VEKAYVLLNVELDSGKEVRDSLEEIPGVKEAFRLYGVYDLIIHIEAETVQDLKDLVANRNRGIRKIRSTLALICIRARSSK